MRRKKSRSGNVRAGKLTNLNGLFFSIFCYASLNAVALVQGDFEKSIVYIDKHAQDITLGPVALQITDEKKLARLLLNFKPSSATLDKIDGYTNHSGLSNVVLKISDFEISADSCLSQARFGALQLNISKGPRQKCNEGEIKELRSNSCGFDVHVTASAASREFYDLSTGQLNVENQRLTGATIVSTDGMYDYKVQCKEGRWAERPLDVANRASAIQVIFANWKDSYFTLALDHALASLATNPKNADNPGQAAKE